MLAALLPAIGRQLLSPVRGLPTAVYLQIAATLINTMGGIAKLFLPLFLLERYQLPYPQIGLLLACYGVGTLSGAYLGGIGSDRYDNRRLACAVLLAGGLLTASLALPLPVWGYVPLLIVCGLADGSFRPCNMRLVLEPCPPAKRPMAQGLYRMAYNLGTALAGISGGLLAAYGYQWVFVAQGVAGVLAALWLGLGYRHLGSRAPMLRQDKPVAAGHGSPWQDRDFLRFLLGLLLIVAVFDQMYGTMGLYLREHYQLGPQWIGYLFTLNGLMVVVLQVWIARRVSGWGLLRCSHLAVLLLGGSYVLLNMGSTLLWPVLTMLVLSLGELLLSPVWSMVVMQCSEGRQRGRYLGLYSAAWSGRTLYAPAVGTWCYGHFGGAWLWWACAALALVTVALQHRPLQRLLARQP